MQKAFDKMHLLMAADTLAAYLDHNKRFDVYTDASARRMYYPRRKADCLLLAKADKISAKLYNNGKGNAFHRCNS